MVTLVSDAHSTRTADHSHRLRDRGRTASADMRGDRRAGFARVQRPRPVHLGRRRVLPLPATRHRRRPCVRVRPSAAVAPRQNCNARCLVIASRVSHGEACTKTNESRCASIARIQYEPTLCGALAERHERTEALAWLHQLTDSTMNEWQVIELLALFTDHVPNRST